MSQIKTIDHDEVVPPHAQEIEFALLLSRMINTLKEDPEQLRLTIYDYARTKLTSDLSSIDESEKKRLLASLETAIQGVEKFSLRTDQVAQLGRRDEPSQQTLRLRSSRSANPLVAVNSQSAEPQRYTPEPLRVYPGPSAPSLQLHRSWALAPSLIMFAIFGLLAGSAVAAAVYVQHNIAQQGAANSAQSEVLQQVAARVSRMPEPSSPNSPPFPVPSVYGIYALNDGALSELDALPEQVPDKRIAMSTPVTKPSRTTLRDGHARFVAFRRDLAGDAPDRVDVRVVAQVMRSLTFDASGKAKVQPVTDAWNIRNISHQFRVRPIQGNPEMLLIQSEKDDFTLPPGRYVLALKNQGYDFTVAGTISDPSQCLERTEAANGTFYSDCKSP
jgi:hypothetical protein